MFEFSEAFWSQFPEIVLRLAVATACGVLLGMERERKDKPAGLRTVTLITTGAALYMVVSALLPITIEGNTDIIRVDPSRIAAQVVTGIGFLGAGTIIQGRGSVHGLTTAAMIWVSAGIGLCVGAGFPLLGFGMTLLVLATLVAMAPLRRWISRRGGGETIRFLAHSDTLTLSRVYHHLMSFDVGRDEIDIAPYGDDTVLVTARHFATGDSVDRLLDALDDIDGVSGLPLPTA